MKRAFSSPAILCALALAASSAARANSELVGPESCATCHKAAYQAWKSSPHARAHLSLTAEQKKQQLCLSCHSRDEQRAGQAQVQGVSCETCHGAGRSYQTDVVMRDPELARLLGLAEVGEQSCLMCHNANAPSAGKFDFKAALGRIDHWSAERAAREQKAAAPAAPKDSALAGRLKDK